MCLRDRDPAAAIDWLARAFGVEPEIVVAGGAVVHHAQLRYGADLIVIGPAPDAPNGGALAHAEYRTGPGYTYLVVDDPDAHHARSIEAGARIVRQLPTEHHGSRGCTALDPEDNVWSLGTGRPSGHASGATHVRRTVPDVYSADLAASVAFYETLGLEVVMDQGWIVTLASPCAKPPRSAFSAQIRPATSPSSASRSTTPTPCTAASSPPATRS